MKQEKTGTFLNFTLQELEQGLANHLLPSIREEIEKIHKEKPEDDDNPITLEEAAEFMKVSRSTFSGWIGKGEIPYVPVKPDHKKAKKLFFKRDLKKWVEQKKVKTIQELKAGGYGKSKS